MNTSIFFLKKEHKPKKNVHKKNGMRSTGKDPNQRRRKKE